MQDMTVRLLKGGVWAFWGKVFGAFSGLAISALLSRLLSPDELGAYFLTFSLVSVAAVVAQLGLTQITVRYVAEAVGNGDLAKAKHSIVLILRIVAISAVIIACLMTFFVGDLIAVRFFHSDFMAKYIGLVSVWIVIVALQQIIAEAHRGIYNIRLAILSGGLLTSFISMILFYVLWLVQEKGGFSQILLLTIGSGLASVLMSSALLWKRFHGVASLKCDDGAMRVLRISWPLWITNLTLLALSQTGLWIMGGYRPPEEVAVYGAVTRVVALVAMPLLVVNAVVPPIISEMNVKRKLSDLEQSLRYAATLAFIPAIFMFIVFVFWGDEFLSWFFGGFYKSGGAMLVLLAAGQLMNVWAGSCGQVLMLTGHQVAMMLITMLCGILILSGSWWLVQGYGGIGVAAASSGGLILQNVLMLICAKKYTGLWTNAKLHSLK